MNSSSLSTTIHSPPDVHAAGRSHSPGNCGADSTCHTPPWSRVCNAVRRRFTRWSGAGIAATLLLLLPACTTPDTRLQPAPEPPLALRSPDGTISVHVSTDGPLLYAVNVDKQQLIAASRLGLRFDDATGIGADVQLVNVSSNSVDQTWENRLGKRRTVRDHYNELRLEFKERSTGQPFEVVFRAFNDGVGFRYVLLGSDESDPLLVQSELTQFAFNDDHTCFAGRHADNKGFVGSQEWEFLPQRLRQLPLQTPTGLPLLVQTPEAWVAITESDLRDWAGMWISRSPARNTSLEGVTLQTRLAPRREGRGAVLARLPHASPWRVVMIGRQLGRLIESDLVMNLASPSRIADTSWIRPGLMAWDHWWSGDVRVDTETVKKYIELAAANGWPYQLIDWQWYGPFNTPNADITKINPALDMNELRRFAQEKNVRLWLWLHWTDVERNDAYQRAFPIYRDWGIAGVKIDFMDSDDQWMVNWYEKLARAAAENRLMINFHGAHKPAGLNRTWPNEVTREGVLGNEYNRWSRRVTPEHKVTLPFTRFLAGPGDFTPGGFLNRQPARFEVRSHQTQVQGTRAAELALFVVYDSPVCCVCDRPEHYAEQPGIDFLQKVPTVWDDTRVLEGAVGDYLVMARRSGNAWFAGALTDGSARSITLDLSFLAEGAWTMTLWRDAPDSEIDAQRMTVETREVNAGDRVPIRLAAAGGLVAHFVKR